jgi:hypothetical protein
MSRCLVVVSNGTHYFTHSFSSSRFFLVSASRSLALAVELPVGGAGFALVLTLLWMRKE